MKSSASELGLTLQKSKYTINKLSNKQVERKNNIHKREKKHTREDNKKKEETEADTYTCRVVLFLFAKFSREKAVFTS